MRKVFRYFEKHILMNSKIAISVIISAIIVVVGIFAITSQESETIKIENTLNKELQSTDEITPEIHTQTKPPFFILLL